jgi:hypothetical protein
MAKPQRYVYLSNSKLRATEEQKAFVDQFVTRRGDSINQVIRDMIQHCMECPFFLSNGSTSGSIPPVKERP